MLTRLRTRLRHPFVGKHAEDGFTLIEVAVAMFVFMIVSLAILSGVILTRTVSSDAQARQTASNLATAAINVARTTKNLNDLESSTSTQTVAGRVYAVTTTARWAPSNTGVTTQCSTGTGAVLGKSVQVTVSWSGAGSTATPVTMTALVASTSAVTQVGNGSIMVQVTNAQGLPFSAGGALAITPVAGSGAATPAASSVPATIDTQGCAFIPNLVPGSYNVTIGTTYNGVGVPYVDTKGSAQSSAPWPVTANTMTPAIYTYDQSTPVAVTFGPSGATVPVGIQASFVHNDTITRPAGGCNGVPAQFCLFPFINGYTLVAGNLGSGAAPSCESVDPAQWQAGTDQSGNSYTQGVSTPVVTTAGAAVTATAPMGTVAVTGLAALVPSVAGGAVTINAQQQSASPSDAADPGCVAAASIAYSFPPMTSDTATLALPYGTWALSYAASIPYTLQCTATRSGSNGNYSYTCNSAGTSAPTGYTPLPATNSAVPATANCTSSGYSHTYTCSWSVTGTTASGPLSDADVTPPALPSVYSDSQLTLDPRAAVS